MIPIVLVSELWFSDWLSKYAENANCYSYREINGVYLVFYGLFVFLPLSFAIILFIFDGGRSIKVIKLGQNPLPNEKGFSPTKYKYGAAAKIKPFVAFSLIFFSGRALYMGWVSNERIVNRVQVTSRTRRTRERAV